MADSAIPNLIYHPSRSGLEKFWGKTEACLLDIIWENGPITVKRALFFARKTKPYAYTTIMTMMNHLVKKGILKREKSGHSFVYSPLCTKEEFLTDAIQTIYSGLLKDYPNLTGVIITRNAKSHKKRK